MKCTEMNHEYLDRIVRKHARDIMVGFTHTETIFTIHKT